MIASRAAAAVKTFGLTVLAALASVIDTFNRADNASNLGSINGQKWKIWAGVWAILTNKASSSSAASTNAMATLTFTKTDVTISISGADPGLGAAFWVTDANNWYASVYTQTQVCQTCVICNAWNISNCNANCCNGPFNTWSPYCIAWNASSCISWTLGNCNVFNSANTGNKAPPYGFCYAPSRNPSTCTGGYNPSNCSTPITGNCASGTFCCGTYNGSFCNSQFNYSCNCTTEHRVNIIKSISGVVSTVSANLFSAAVASFKTALSGSTATITAYSATNYTTQIGNAVATSISPAPIKKSVHGIIKSSSPYAQGSAIDEFGVQ